MASPTSPSPTALTLFDEINNSLTACAEFIEMLRFFTTHAVDLGQVSDEEKVWAGVARVHEFIGHEVAEAHEKTAALYELTAEALKVGAR